MILFFWLTKELSIQKKKKKRQFFFFNINQDFKKFQCSPPWFSSGIILVAWDTSVNKNRFPDFMECTFSQRRQKIGKTY